jgi:hypothetical protein
LIIKALNPKTSNKYSKYHTNIADSMQEHLFVDAQTGGSKLWHSI